MSSVLARLGGPRFPILLAVGLAVAARLFVPPVAERPANEAELASASPVLPARAKLPPEPRPGLPTGIPIVFAPVNLAVPSAIRMPDRTAPGIPDGPSPIADALTIAPHSATFLRAPAPVEVKALP